MKGHSNALVSRSPLLGQSFSGVIPEKMYEQEMHKRGLCITTAFDKIIIMHWSETLLE